MGTKDTTYFGKGIWWAAVTSGALYTVTYLIRLILSYHTWRSTNIDGGWNITVNPQSLIALCLAVSVLALLSGNEKGKILASLLSIIVLAKYAHWAYITEQIKINTGLSHIPNANWIGDVLIGGGYGELCALLAALSLLSSGVWMIWQYRNEPSRHLHEATP